MSEERSVATVAQDLAPLVRLSGVVKSFGGVRALKGVDFELLPGEVHALLGENGAGKSTLIKILSGVNSRDGGTLEVSGQETEFRSPSESREAGLAVVYQELSLVPSLSVAANLFLGREPRYPLGVLRKREVVRQARELLERYGIPLDPGAKVEDLPFAHRQMTEICKALAGEVKILVLDEPTSALTGGEEEILFDAIRQVTRRGVGVVYVTHRLNEVFRISQRVTVLRDGSNVGTFATADSDMKSLVAAIVGPKQQRARLSTETEGGDAAAPGAHEKPAAAPLLMLSAVSNDRLKDLDLEVRKGEIHGLAGVIGSGRTEVLETVFGLRRLTAGEIAFDGTVRKLRNPSDAIRLGIALAPEDRHREGLVLDHSIERNLALTRLPALSRFGWFDRKGSRSGSAAAMEELAVKAPNASTLVKNLSGGNQQKIVFAKWRDPMPTLLLLDEPTVGVDVGAREEIYDVVRRTVAGGSAALVVSSDLVELLLICHRISIVVDGRVVQTLAREEIENEEQLHYLIQHAQSQPLEREPS